MANRNYSSYLLRFWQAPTSTGSSADSSTVSPTKMVVQLQHLQSGITWRLNNLEELNQLLATTLSEDSSLELQSNLTGDLDRDVEVE